MTPSKLRVVYVGGWGDPFRTLRNWRDGARDDVSSHITYSSQFFDVCREFDASALLLTTSAGDPVSASGITVAPRPNRLHGPTGFSYHLGHVQMAVDLMRDVRKFDANLLITSNEPHPWLTGPLRFSGVRVVQALHCRLWPEGVPQSSIQKALLSLTGRTYARSCDAILSASEAINRQVRKLTTDMGHPSPPILDFLPQYHPDSYGGLPAPKHPAGQDVFRVLFIGRVERNKGVFDLLEVARRLRAMGRNDVVIELCGDGKALPELRERVKESALSESFVIHGWCNREQLRTIYERAQSVIVPTSMDFVEGFNQVAVESLLAGRPAIVSDVCPAYEYVTSAVVVVPADDVDSYLRAMLSLADDPVRYAALQANCEPESRKFFDPNTNYASALREVFSAVSEGRPIASRSIPTGSVASASAAA